MCLRGHNQGKEQAEQDEVRSLVYALLAGHCEVDWALQQKHVYNATSNTIAHINDNENINRQAKTHISEKFSGKRWLICDFGS